MVLITQAQVEKKASGFIGREVTLKCGANITDTDVVTWSDMVYNTERKPMLIYSSDTDSINQDHPNKDFYTVHNNELTISGLKDADVGEYTCMVTHANDAATEQHVYTLNLLCKYNSPCVLVCKPLICV